MPVDGAARLLPVLADLPGAGWQALPVDGVEPRGGAGPADAELGRLLVAHLDEDDVVDLADSPMFVREPARLVYATAAVLATDRAGEDAFRTAASPELARTLAEATAADTVTEPGTTTLLGSHTAPLAPLEAPLPLPPGVRAAAHRTTFAGADRAGMVGVHVDLVVLGAALGTFGHGIPRIARNSVPKAEPGRAGLLLVWLGDSPDPFPAADRAEVVARLAGRLVG